MKNQVIIQFKIEGFHKYPNAPQDVSFLSNIHRHVFSVKCFFAVAKLTREREIFICREQVKNRLIEKYGEPCMFNDCEMVATEILKYWQQNGMVACEVWEENTGGARIEL